MDENIESLANMYDNLRENEINPDQLPLLMQYNKRDLPDIVPITDLEQTLNLEGRPCTEAVAVEGLGVFDTLKRITKMVLEDTKRRTSGAVAVPASPSAMPVLRPMTVRAPGGNGDTAADEEATSAAAVATVAAERAAAPPPAVSSSRSSDYPAPRAVPADRVIFATRAASPRDAPPIMAAQRSTRVRHRHRSLIDRLFGWLFGR